MSGLAGWTAVRREGKQSKQVNDRHRIGYNRRVPRFLVLAFLLIAPASAAPSWERLETRGGISVYRREVPGSRVLSFKGECEIEAPIAKVISALSDVTRKREWVFSLAEARLVREPSVLERVEYNRSSAPWPIHDRAFVFRALVRPDRAARRLWIGLESVEDPAAPPEPGVVRGRIEKGEFIVEALGDRRTKGSLEMHADPAGAVPKWLVNLFQKRWPLETLAGLKRQVAKADIEAHPALADF